MLTEILPPLGLRMDTKSIIVLYYLIVNITITPTEILPPQAEILPPLTEILPPLAS